MAANDSTLLRYAMITSVQKLAGDKMKYNRFPKNTETQQENTKENTVTVTNSQRAANSNIY